MKTFKSEWKRYHNDGSSIDKNGCKYDSIINDEFEVMDIYQAQKEDLEALNKMIKEQRLEGENWENHVWEIEE